MSTNQAVEGQSSPPAAPTPDTTGSGSQPTKGKRWGNNRERRRGNGGHPAPKPHVPKFKGNKEALGDEYVYDMTKGREAGNQYTKTSEAIIRYTSNKYKNGGDVERSLDEGVVYTITWPPAPTPTKAIDPKDPDIPVPAADISAIWLIREG